MLVFRTEGKAERLIFIYTFVAVGKRISLYSKDWLGSHGTAQAVLELEKSGYSDLDLPSKAISYLKE